MFPKSIVLCLPIIVGISQSLLLQIFSFLCSSATSIISVLHLCNCLKVLG